LNSKMLLITLIENNLMLFMIRGHSM